MLMFFFFCVCKFINSCGFPVPNVAILKLKKRSNSKPLIGDYASQADCGPAGSVPSVSTERGSLMDWSPEYCMVASVLNGFKRGNLVVEGVGLRAWFDCIIIFIHV